MILGSGFKLLPLSQCLGGWSPAVQRDIQHLASLPPSRHNLKCERSDAAYRPGVRASNIVASVSKITGDHHGAASHEEHSPWLRRMLQLTDGTGRLQILEHVSNVHGKARSWRCRHDEGCVVQVRRLSHGKLFTLKALPKAQLLTFPDLQLTQSVTPTYRC